MNKLYAWLAGVASLCLLCPVAMADKQIKSGEYRAAVVELYTSEGCSSCPPADEFLSKIGKTREADQIIPLAFHVDYWDYIGWEDPYAKAEYTQRQRKVAKVNKQNSIYTPEFVVDGAEARGSRGVTKQVKRAHKNLAEADIELNLSAVMDGQLTANVTIDNLKYEGKDKPQVYLAIYESGLSSEIKAGENRGRYLNHDYVVRYLSKAQNTGEGEMHSFDITLAPEWNRDEIGLTVVVKLKKSGRTLQALKSVL